MKQKIGKKFAPEMINLRPFIHSFMHCLSSTVNRMYMLFLSVDLAENYGTDAFSKYKNK